jgi:hypothetical protein
MVHAFEANMAETKTMLSTIREFMSAHRLPDVTVVADAGMISEAGQKAIEAAGLSFILGMRIPGVPYVVAQWRREHPGQDIPGGHIFTQPWPAGPSSKRRDQVIYYQYRHDRAHRTLRGIDEQVAKAENAVAGKAPAKRNRFIQLSAGTTSVNRDLEEKARAIADLKGYVTDLAACPDGTPITAEFVTGAHHQFFQIEKSFRMPEHDLQARPIYHHLRDSIEAHLIVVFAVLAEARFLNTSRASPIWPAAGPTGPWTSGSAGRSRRIDVRNDIPASLSAPGGGRWPPGRAAHAPDLPRGRQARCRSPELAASGGGPRLGRRRRDRRGRDRRGPGLAGPGHLCDWPG